MMRRSWSGALGAALLGAALGTAASADPGSQSAPVAPAPATTAPAPSAPSTQAPASKGQGKATSKPARQTAVFGIHIGAAPGTLSPVVTEIDRGSPARSAGLRRGD